MKYFLDLADSGTLVFWMKSPKPLLGVRFSHPLPFRIISSSGAAFFIDMQVMTFKLDLLSAWAVLLSSLKDFLY